MSFAPSSNLDGKLLLGLTLLLMLLFSWMAGIKNVVVEWVSPSSENVFIAPNILMIVVDDLGYNDTNAINPDGIVTPHITELAQNGVTFRRHYADSTCTPSRVALLTGRYPERSGFRPIGIEIPAEYSTIAEQLQSAGYMTYMTGKWHAGEGRVEAWPQHKGFHEWFGFLNQWELSGEVTDANKGGTKRPTYRNPMLRVNGGVLEQHDGHLTDILTQHTVEKIKHFQAQKQPWFLYHAFLAPHHPIQPDERYKARFPDTPAGEYTALVTQLDDAIGQILATVDRKNTLVVFISDNGGTNRQLDNNYPFYGKKADMFEGAYRTPLIINWPGAIPAGKIIDDTVMNVDVYPTLLASARSPIPENLDGNNLWPVISGDARSQRTGRSWEVFSSNVEALRFSFLSASDQWRLSSTQGLKPSLFNLSAEPAGKTNVAEQHPDKVRELTRDFWQAFWMKSLLPVAEELGPADNQRRYTGFDAMRTPLHYGLAIGLEIGPLPQNVRQQAGDSAVVLAGQEGFWQLRYSGNLGLEWVIGNQILRDASFEPSRCNAIVLTNYFQPLAHLPTRAPRSKIKMYSAGLLRDFERNFDYTTITGDAIETPTLVNYGGRARFSNLLLSAYSDNYAPQVKPEFLEIYTNAFKDQTLTLADVELMTSELCQ